jgi:FtsZ-binding cell division protein ZapB
MPKRKANEQSIEFLQYEIERLKKENSKTWHENQSLTEKINTYHEIISSLINDQSFWSEKSLKTGLIDRLKTLIK